MVRYKLRKQRPKALFGDAAAAITAAGITAAATAASAALQAKATKDSAKQQSQSINDNAVKNAEALKEQNENNNKLAEESQEFTKEQNEENRQIQRNIQLQLALLTGQSNENDRLDASKIQVKNGGSMNKINRRRKAPNGIISNNNAIPQLVPAFINPTRNQIPNVGGSQRTMLKRGGVPYASFTGGLNGNNIPFRVTDGGGVIPLGITPEGYNLYELYGNDHDHYHKAPGGKHKTGVGIKFANSNSHDNNVIEGEGNQHSKHGELMLTTPNDAYFISKHNIAGFNPAKAVYAGLSPTLAFQTQEYLKDLYGISDSGKYKAKYGKKMTSGGNIGTVPYMDIVPDYTSGNVSVGVGSQIPNPRRGMCIGGRYSLKYGGRRQAGLGDWFNDKLNKLAYYYNANQRADRGYISNLLYGLAGVGNAGWDWAIDKAGAGLNYISNTDAYKAYDKWMSEALKRREEYINSHPNDFTAPELVGGTEFNWNDPEIQKQAAKEISNVNNYINTADQYLQNNLPKGLYDIAGGGAALALTLPVFPGGSKMKIFTSGIKSKVGKAILNSSKLNPYTKQKLVKFGYDHGITRLTDVARAQKLVNAENRKRTSIAAFRSMQEDQAAIDKFVLEHPSLTTTAPLDADIEAKYNFIEQQAKRKFPNINDVGHTVDNAEQSAYNEYLSSLYDRFSQPILESRANMNSAIRDAIDAAHPSAGQQIKATGEYFGDRLSANIMENAERRAERVTNPTIPDSRIAAAREEAAASRLEPAPNKVEQARFDAEADAAASGASESEIKAAGDAAAESAQTGEAVENATNASRWQRAKNWYNNTRYGQFMHNHPWARRTGNVIGGLSTLGLGYFGINGIRNLIDYWNNSDVRNTASKINSGANYDNRGMLAKPDTIGQQILNDSLISDTTRRDTTAVSQSDSTQTQNQVSNNTDSISNNSSNNNVNNTTSNNSVNNTNNNTNNNNTNNNNTSKNTTSSNNNKSNTTNSKPKKINNNNISKAKDGDDFSRWNNFNDAFDHARNAGVKTFKWNGKLYGTVEATGKARERARRIGANRYITPPKTNKTKNKAKNKNRRRLHTNNYNNNQVPFRSFTLHVEPGDEIPVYSEETTDSTRTQYKYGGRLKAAGGRRLNNINYNKGQYYAAGLDMLGAGLGTGISMWANNKAARDLSNAYLNAGNIMANAYRQLQTIDDSTVDRNDYRAAHALAQLQSPIRRNQSERASINRMYGNINDNIARNISSGVAQLQSLNRFNNDRFDKLNQTEENENKRLDEIANKNAERLTTVANDNANRDTNAMQQYTKDKLALKQYNNDIINQRIIGSNSALADAATQSAGVLANTGFQNASLAGNMINRLGEVGGNALTAIGKHNSEMNANYIGYGGTTQKVDFALGNEASDTQLEGIARTLATSFNNDPDNMNVDNVNNLRRIGQTNPKLLRRLGVDVDKLNEWKPKAGVVYHPEDNNNNGTSPNAINSSNIIQSSNVNSTPIVTAQNYGSSYNIPNMPVNYVGFTNYPTAYGDYMNSFNNSWLNDRNRWRL